MCSLPGFTAGKGNRLTSARGRARGRSRGSSKAFLWDGSRGAMDRVGSPALTCDSTHWSCQPGAPSLVPSLYGAVGAAGVQLLPGWTPCGQKPQRDLYTDSEWPGSGSQHSCGTGRSGPVSLPGAGRGQAQLGSGPSTTPSAMLVCFPRRLSWSEQGANRGSLWPWPAPLSAPAASFHGAETSASNRWQ